MHSPSNHRRYMLNAVRTRRCGSRCGTERSAVTVQAGDGDCGATVQRGSEAVLGTLDTLAVGDLGSTAKRLAVLLGEKMGGTSGALYQIFFAAAAGTLNGIAAEAAGLEDWAAALQAGVEAVQRYGLAAVGDRTMVDALEPAMRAVNASVEAGVAFGSAACHARDKLVKVDSCSCLCGVLACDACGYGPPQIA